VAQVVQRLRSGLGDFAHGGIVEDDIGRDVVARGSTRHQRSFSKSACSSLEIGLDETGTLELRLAFSGLR
jgi:hypothetical protein